MLNLSLFSPFLFFSSSLILFHFLLHWRLNLFAHACICNNGRHRIIGHGCCCCYCCCCCYWSLFKNFVGLLGSNKVPENHRKKTEVVGSIWHDGGNEMGCTKDTSSRRLTKLGNFKNGNHSKVVESIDCLFKLRLNKLPWSYYKVENPFQWSFIIGYSCMAD